MALTESQRQQIREVASHFVGFDARIHVLTRDLGPGSRDVWILVEAQRPVRSLEGAQRQLASKLGSPLPGYKAHVTLIDSKTPVKMEHKRIRMTGTEI